MAAAGAAGRKAPALPRVSGGAVYQGKEVTVTVMLPEDPSPGQAGRLLIEQRAGDDADAAVLLDAELQSRRFSLEVEYGAGREVEELEVLKPSGVMSGDDDDGDMAEMPLFRTTRVATFYKVEKDFVAVADVLMKHASNVASGNLRVDDIGVYGAHEGAVGTDLLRAPTLDQEGTADAADRITRQLQREKERSADEVVNRFVAHEHCFVDEAGRRALMERVDAVVVDDQADTKLVLTVAELEAVVGAAAVAKMQEAFGVSIDEVKLRRVSATPEREVINFHLDFAHRTMGIPLNDSTEYEGSRLLYAIPGEGVVAAPRGKAGSATVHDNTLPHGVTPLTRGIRYGLFLLNHTA